MQPKGNFWNNWDFKSILTIIGYIVVFAYGYGNLKSDVTNYREAAERERSAQMKKIDEMQEELKEFIKEYREDKRIQENNIKDFYKNYKLEHK